MCSITISKGQLLIRKLANRPRAALVPFLAPEIFRGERPTKACDAYSFGLLMWVMLGLAQSMSKWCCCAHAGVCLAQSGGMEGALGPAASMHAQQGLLLVKAHCHVTHPSTPNQPTNQPLALALLLYCCVPRRWELYTGSVVFSNFASTPTKLVQTVISDGLRPQFPDTAPAWYVALATRCWQPNPKQRPSFRKIIAALLDAGRKKGDPGGAALPPLPAQLAAMLQLPRALAAPAPSAAAAAGTASAGTASPAGPSASGAATAAAAAAVGLPAQAGAAVAGGGQLAAAGASAGAAAMAAAGGCAPALVGAHAGGQPQPLGPSPLGPNGGAAGVSRLSGPGL